MSSELASQGSLFSADFLHDSIRAMPEWAAVDDAQVAELQGTLQGIFERFPTRQTPNESQTEDDLIWPVLQALGWTSSLRQQNLSARGRDDVPDGLLFENDDRKAHANRFPEEWKRYEFGLAVVESKRWLRPLDRRSGRRGEEPCPFDPDAALSAPHRWGMLTNGSRSRLYGRADAEAMRYQAEVISLPENMLQRRKQHDDRKPNRENNRRPPTEG